MAEKRSVSAREVLADIRVGMTDDQLMVKYGLSHKGFQSLRNRLRERGLLAEPELESESPPTQTPQRIDKNTLARKIAEAVKDLQSDEEIARRFGVSVYKLPHILASLINYGWLTQEDLDRRQSRPEELLDIKLELDSAGRNDDVPVESGSFAAVGVKPQIPLRSDSKNIAKRIALAIKAGWSDDELAASFGFPAERLANVFAALIEYGYLTREDCERSGSRREETTDTELYVKSTAKADVSETRAPFAAIRGRTILASLVLASIAAVILSGIIWGVWGIRMESPLGGAICGILFYVFLLLCAAYLLYRAKLSPVALLGSHNPPWPLVKRSLLLVIPLIGFSIAGVFFLYLPLSYLAPGFVQWQLFSHTPEIIVCTTDYTYIPVNLLNLFTIVLIAPVVEEFFMRGLLLTRWSFKWNVPLGILGSSIVFCLLHCDIIGSFFFSFVASVLYIQTRSLFIPITIHMVNNAIVWVLAGVDMLAGEPSSLKTVTQFQSVWWIGLAAGVITIPWVIWFTKRYFPRADWRVPYLSLQEGT